MVDSGADGTLLPLDILPWLGVDPAQVQKCATGSQGAGETSFETWTTTASINAQVLWLNGGTVEPWGPSIPLHPVFAKDTVALFGRRDFFQPFAVSFVTLPEHGAVFHLDYNEGGTNG